MEAEARISTQADDLLSLSKMLESRAAAFEAVDEAALTSLGRLIVMVRGWIEEASQALKPYVDAMELPWEQIGRYLRLGLLLQAGGKDSLGGLGTPVPSTIVPTPIPIPTPTPTPTPSETPTPMPKDSAEEDEIEEKKSILERFADKISEPGTLWGILTDNEVAELMRKVKNLPDITVVLPMLRGFGMDDVTGPLIRSIDLDMGVRSFGRLIGDVGAGPLFGVGWGITLAPEQLANIKTGAPWNEFVADALIDSAGFVGSEGAGWVVGVGAGVGGAAIGHPEVALPVKISVDLGAGMIYDSYIDENNIRDWLTGKIGDLPDEFRARLADGSEWEIRPIPTPPEGPWATGTPTPNSSTRSPPTSTPSPPD
jgi:hypothetical protein